MGLLGKLMFWKRKDEFENIGLGDKGAPLGMDLGLGSDFGAGADTGADLSQGYGMQPSPGTPRMRQPSFQQPQFQPSFPSPNFNQQMQGQDYVTSKNLEVISSKLDALRAALDSINQRLANLEAIARGEEEQRYKRRW